MNVSITVGTLTATSAHPPAPVPGGLPATGAVLATYLVAFALLALCIGVLLVRLGRGRRERRVLADVAGGVA